jgi:hypothetical protein
VIGDRKYKRNLVYEVRLFFRLRGKTAPANFLDKKSQASQVNSRSPVRLLYSWEGKEMSALGAIKKYCRWCCCDQPKEVRLCAEERCPIHPYRTGKMPKIEKPSPLKATRLRCLDCVQSLVEVKKCSSAYCALHHSPPCLVYHPVKNTDNLFEFFRQCPGSDGCHEISTLEAHKDADGFHSISFNPQSDLEKIPIALLANAFLLAAEDLYDALLHHPPVIGKPISGNGAQLLFCRRSLVMMRTPSCRGVESVG